MSRSRPRGRGDPFLPETSYPGEEVGDGVSQIQRMARHRRNQVNIALAWSVEIADQALAIKAAIFWDFGRTARLCGNALQRQASAAGPRIRLVGGSGRALCNSSSLATALQSIELSLWSRFHFLPAGLVFPRFDLPTPSHDGFVLVGREHKRPAIALLPVRGAGCPDRDRSGVSRG